MKNLYKIRDFFDTLCMFLNVSCKILLSEKEVNSSQDFCINDHLYQIFIEIFKQSDIYEANKPNILNKDNIDSLKK